MFILIKADGMTGVWNINKTMKLHSSETVIKKNLKGTINTLEDLDLPGKITLNHNLQGAEVGGLAF